MNRTLFIKNPALSKAEEHIIDSILAIADDSGLQSRVQWQPTNEPNSVKLLVTLSPPLLEPYERVAWRRTYQWVARHWRLPARLIGTRFIYQRDEYEFAGASLKAVPADRPFIAVRLSDGWTMQMPLAFLQQTVLRAMPEEVGLCGIFSVGLGANEHFFQ